MRLYWQGAVELLHGLPGRTTDETIDKRTGERVGAIEIPGPTRYGLSSWVHDGEQYVIIQLNDGLAAFAINPHVAGGRAH